MEGLNTNWSQATSEVKADYKSLFYVDYSFKVKAIGENHLIMLFEFIRHGGIVHGLWHYIYHLR